MKVILAVARDDVAEIVSDALVENDYHVTRVSSSGGFLRRGSTTLVCGVEDDQVEGVLQVIRATCEAGPDCGVYCTTIFVLDSQQMIQI